MRYCLVVTFALWVTSCNGCEEEHTFGAGHITDIFRHSGDSQSLVLKIYNGAYDYCKVLNLQSGELPFEEVSCTSTTKEWSQFPSYPISVQVPDTDAFASLTDAEKKTYIEDAANITDLIVEIGDEDINISVPIFIHPTMYSYFYSPSMVTLFIFTADQMETASALDSTVTFNLVSIIWPPSVTLFPEDMDEFVTDVTMDVNLDHFVGDANALDVLLDGALWKVYDDYDMFMVEIESVHAECTDRDWLRYSYIPDRYTMIQNGNNNDENGTVRFDYAGTGYIGVDDAIKRAYGFTSHSVWYYEVDSDGFDQYRVKSFEFETKDLSSYWAVMWGGIGVVVFFLLCCCCLCMNKKRHNNANGMTAEQEYMTQV